MTLPKSTDESAPLRPADEAVDQSGMTVCGCIRLRQRSSALLLTLALICYAITTKEAGNMTLPSVLPALKDLDDGEGKNLIALLPGVGTGFYAVGKLSQIYSTYHFGGRAVLIAASFGMGVSLLCFTTAIPAAMVISWCSSRFAAAHFWGAATRLIANWVQPGESGKAMASMGLACIGVALFSLAFGCMLDVQPEGSLWRGPFFLVAGCLFSGCLLYAVRSL